MTLHETLLKKATDHGFPLRGALDIDSVTQELARHVERYDSWIASGYAGEMEYLRRGRDRRADPRLVFPKAQSVFCVAMPYWKAAIGDGRTGPRYARYLKGRDYHEQLAENLESLLREVRIEHPELEWKICVDTSAILERSWAALAGLGWIGKNTTLINPKYGSYLFIAEALLSEPVGRGPNPLPNYCGNCTRCLDACPTRAFAGAGLLDARRCISYWTLENRGKLAISDQERSKVGAWVAGCDVCQEVCPFNTKPVRESADDPVRPDDWETLLRETPEEYRARARESALSRVKPGQFSRNLAIALANADPSSWTETLRAEAERRARDEQDDSAREEWARCVNRMLQREPNLSPKI